MKNILYSMKLEPLWSEKNHEVRSWFYKLIGQTGYWQLLEVIFSKFKFSNKL